MPDDEPILPNSQFIARPTVRDTFDAWAREGRADAAARSHLRTARYALDTIHPPADGRLLDLGCGNGYAGDYVRLQHPQTQVVSLDVSLQMLGRVRSLFPAHHAVRADATQIPLADATVDAVFSMEALYYLDDPARAVSEARRVLRSPGSLDIVVDYYAENPHSEDWDQQMQLALTRWTTRQWEQALKGAGFSQVTSRRLFPDLRQEDAVARATEDPDWGQWARDVGSLHIHGKS